MSDNKPAPRQQAQTATVKSQSLSISYEGPLPPAAELARYEQVFAGCAERIVAMAERQSAHRQELERTVVRSNVLSERIGQIAGFAIGLAAILGGVWLIAHDKSTAGLTSIITALGALVGVFVYGRRQQAKEREQKAQANPSRQ